MKYFKVKEKGKEVIVRSCCKTEMDLGLLIGKVKERYNNKYKNCGYKVRDFELEDIQFENDELLTIITIIDTNIEI